VPSFIYTLLRLERFLFGGLPERVRRNTRFDLAGALAYGVFFLPHWPFCQWECDESCCKRLMLGRMAVRVWRASVLYYTNQ
jgi:hypothetical protein